MREGVGKASGQCRPLQQTDAGRSLLGRVGMQRRQHIYPRRSLVRLGEESLDQILVWDVFWLKLVFPIRVSNYLGIIGNPFLF